MKTVLGEPVRYRKVRHTIDFVEPSEVSSMEGCSTVRLTIWG